MDRSGTRGSSSSQLVLPGYRVGKTLGIGAFGKVKLAEHVLTGNKVAVKILKRERINDSERERVIREIKIQRQFAHPHIIRLYEVIESRSNIFLIMEYMDRGDMFDHITERGKLEEAEARFFFQQVVEGVLWRRKMEGFLVSVTNNYGCRVVRNCMIFHHGHAYMGP